MLELHYVLLCQLIFSLRILVRLLFILSLQFQGAVIGVGQCWLSVALKLKWMIDATLKKNFNRSFKHSTLDLRYQVIMFMPSFSQIFGVAWCTQVVFQFFILLLLSSTLFFIGFIKPLYWNITKEQADLMNNWPSNQFII